MPLDSEPTSPLVAAADSSVVTNPWSELRRFTPARIGLGRAGISLPTAAQLDFQLAHAQARDAVHRPLDVQALCAEIEALGLATVPLHSAATTRAMARTTKPSKPRCLIDREKVNAHCCCRPRRRIDQD